MTFGLACDRDGYDLRIAQCSVCLSRGCARKDRCHSARPAFALKNRAERARADTDWLWFAPDFPLFVPNRLKGAYINDEGDAV